ncbi:MAG: prepilin peptidase [Spirochaetales bacterium]|nr:prepilin peptidase [Spirochaetales bacterium]
MEKTFADWLSFGVFLLFSVPIIIHDLKEQQIPDIYLILCTVTLLVFRWFISKDSSLFFLLHMFIGFLLIFVLWYFSHGKIGLGDAKLSAVIALFLGFEGWLFSMILASLLGSMAGAILLFKKKLKENEGIPFAPFMIIGGVFSFFFTDFMTRILYG